MECTRVQELLPFYIRADLPDEEHQAVAQHLAGCAPCQREMAQMQHMDRLLREYVAAIPVANVSVMKGAVLSRISQPRLWPALARPAAIGLLVLVLLVGLAATAVAVYQRIVVVEPSRVVPSLEEAVQRAGFPIWVSSIGELWRVSELDEGRHYTVFLDYRLDDGRRFAISEMFALYHAHRWGGCSGRRVGCGRSRPPGGPLPTPGYPLQRADRMGKAEPALARGRDVPDPLSHVSEHVHPG